MSELLEHLQPKEFETITVADTAIGITAAIRGQADGGFTTKAKAALIGPVETAQIRYKLDGTSPTSAVGHLLEIGDERIIIGEVAVENLKMIRTGSSSASVPVTCFY